MDFASRGSSVRLRPASTDLMEISLLCCTINLSLISSSEQVMDQHWFVHLSFCNSQSGSVCLDQSLTYSFTSLHVISRIPRFHEMCRSFHEGHFRLLFNANKYKWKKIRCNRQGIVFYMKEKPMTFCGEHLKCNFLLTKWLKILALSFPVNLTPSSKPRNLHNSLELRNVNWMLPDLFWYAAVHPAVFLGIHGSTEGSEDVITRWLLRCWSLSVILQIFCRFLTQLRQPLKSIVCSVTLSLCRSHVIESDMFPNSVASFAMWLQIFVELVTLLLCCRELEA